MKYSVPDLSGFWHRSGAFVLALFFFLGLVSGSWISASAGELLFPAMRSAAAGSVSVVGLLSAAVLPFLFSAFAVYLAQPVLLLPIAFWKAFLFSYLGFGLYAAWGSAGWLIAGLMLSADLCAMPVLCWYWMRHIGGRGFEAFNFCLILGILLLIGILNCYFVVPFLETIITF